MANNYFQFKEFKIIQDQCAMKVTTDGCLFGALIQAPDTLTEALDVGTGTGLLSLMVAQRIPSIPIDAIEIDKNAYHQAKENIAVSKWSSQIKVHHTSLQQFTNDKKYELIFSNPPFFKDHLKGKNAQRNQAIHNELLPFDILAIKIKALLAHHGYFWVMYPAFEMIQFIIQCEKVGLFPQLEYTIKNQSNGEIFRQVICFGHNKTKGIKSEQIMKRNEQNAYTNEFIRLLKSYYLGL